MRDIVGLALGVITVAIGCYLVYCGVKLLQTRSLARYLPRMLSAVVAELVVIAVLSMR